MNSFNKRTMWKLLWFCCFLICSLCFWYSCECWCFFFQMDRQISKSKYITYSPFWISRCEQVTKCKGCNSVVQTAYRTQCSSWSNHGLTFRVGLLNLMRTLRVIRSWLQRWRFEGKPEPTSQIAEYVCWMDTASEDMKCLKTYDIFGVKCCVHTIAYTQYRWLWSIMFCWFVKKQEVYDMWIWYNDYNILWYLNIFNCICRKVGAMTQRLLDQLASGIHHPVTESTHWEFAWCPLEILFEVASVYNPNLCRVLFVGSNKSPFFLRGKSLSRQFPFGSDRSGGKAEKLAPCDLLLFWTYSSLKIPLEICWKVDVFVCFSFDRCWSHQHSRGFFGECPKAFGSWLLLVSLWNSVHWDVRSVRWQVMSGDRLQPLTRHRQTHKR